MLDCFRGLISFFGAGFELLLAECIAALIPHFSLEETMGATGARITNKHYGIVRRQSAHDTVAVFVVLLL